MTMHDGSVMTRRHLPHIENAGKTYMVTFATKGRFELALAARDIVLETIVHDHRLVYWLHAAVVMPEHVHFIATPLEEWRIAQGVAAREECFGTTQQSITKSTRFRVTSIDLRSRLARSRERSAGL